MNIDIPIYFDSILDAYHRHAHGRSVHLGYYPDDVDPSEFCLQEAQNEFDHRVIKFAGVSTGLKILDVGCGLGGLIERINNLYSKIDIIGCNIDPRQLDVCTSIRCKNDNVIAWVEADASELPIPDHTIDLVLCIEAAFHFRSRKAFFAEACRVLKPGGKLICTDIFLKESWFPEDRLQTGGRHGFRSESVQAFLNRSIHTLLLATYAPWPDPWYATHSLETDLRNAGFASLTIEDWTPPTAPSYAAMTPRNNTFGVIGTSDPLLGSLLTIGFLHQHLLLEYLLYSGIKL
ncbi:MAG: class I SAM-dependent methyltransferase [Planctomycetota bacterium]|jgi:MPBQ/MSBQ methyltransferase